VEHLSTAEIKAVCNEVHQHYMAVMNGTADKDDILYADPEELADEYKFWSTALERRLKYDAPSQDD
jgi:hypothetical protein